MIRQSVYNLFKYHYFCIVSRNIAALAYSCRSSDHRSDDGRDDVRWCKMHDAYTEKGNNFVFNLIWRGLQVHCSCRQSLYFTIMYICHFWHPFSDLASKTHTHSQTWPLRNYVIWLLRLERHRKHFLKSILNSHISLSFLLIRNWNNKYVHTLP